jgi:chromosome segregation ATPase
MRLRNEQHKMLVKRRDDLLTTPRPEFLVTPEEQLILTRLEQLEQQAATLESNAPERRRISRLKGLLVWRLETEYHDRLTQFDENLRQLDEEMATTQAQYDQYVRARQAATHSFEGYDKPVMRLRVHANNATQTIDMLMARQGRLLERVAIEELSARRSRLENYGDKARFALADSYDRATQAQARREGQ